MKKLFSTIFGYWVLGFGVCTAAIIDPSRIITSWDQAGIPGGIPNSSNMTTFITIAPGNMNISYINTQIGNCPSNQVIQLPAGTYNVDTLSFGMNHGVVVRGAGRGVTILNGASMYMGQSSGTAKANPLVVSGSTKGSSNIVVASSTNFRVGDYMTLEGGDDPAVTILPGTEDNGPGQPCQAACARITGVNGTTITFTPPLPYTLLTSGAYHSQALRAVIYNNGNSTPNMATRCGLENVTCHLNGNEDNGMWMNNVAYCWLKNVEVYHTGKRTIYWIRGFGCQVEHCFIHDPVQQGPGGYGFTLEPAFYCLIQNNVTSNTSGTYQFNLGAAGNVIAYNYCVKTISDFDNCIPDFQDHSGTPVMNLFEGNWGFMAFFDDIHGSAAYTTMFRNRLTGWQPPVPGNPSWGIHQQYAIATAVNIQYNNYVANVLGDVPGATVRMLDYMQVNPTGGLPSGKATLNTGRPAIFALDADYDVNLGGATYTSVHNAYTTTFIHANWDSINGAIMWDALNSTNSDRTIPDSLYLTTKPSWWGNLAWPPFNPSNVTAAAMSPTNLPAGYWGTFGADPPADSSTNPPSITSQPTGTTNSTDNGFLLSVSATGSGSLSYQWRTNNSNVSGATSSTYGSTPAVTLQSGDYTVKISNAYGSITSAPTATLLITNIPPSAPTITVQPVGVTNSTLNGFSLSVTAIGTPTLTYQWKSNEVSLGGATSSTYSFIPALTSYSANYSVVVANGTGSDTSATATVLITNANNLVLALGFEEGTGTNSVDASAYGNNGSLRGGATWATGKYGNGLYFPTNNTATLFLVPYSTSIDQFTNLGITVEAWVYPVYARTAWSTLFYHSDGNVSEYIFNGTTTTSGHPSFSILGSGQYAPTSLPVSNWVYVAATYNRTNRIIYTNGVIAATAAATGDMVANTGFPLTIGGNTYSPEETWGGFMDEVRIYNRALSASEIATDMATPITATTNAPIISVQPVGTTNSTAVGFSLAVSATGTAPLAYQWRSNNVNLANATNASYSQVPALPNYSADYRVVITNSVGSVTSSVATVLMNTANNLVLAMGFEEGGGMVAVDSSTYGNHGALQGGAVFSISGKFGNSAYFPTNNPLTMIRVPWSSSIDWFTNSGITLEAWVYPMFTRSGWSTIFFHGNEDINDVEYIINGTTTTSGHPSFWLLNSGQYLTNSFAISNWTHIAATYNLSSRIVYTNGVISSSNAATGTMTSNGGFPLTIGGNQFFSAEAWGGLIDEVRIYNRALSAAEIQADMITPISVITPPIDNGAPRPPSGLFLAPP